MIEPEVIDRDTYTLVTVADYDALDHALSYEANKTEPSKPLLIKFEVKKFDPQAINDRYIRPPRYRDGLCVQTARELVFDQTDQKWITQTYHDTVAKHVVTIKPADGPEYHVIIYNIKDRDLKDDLFMRGLLFDEWEPYLKREQAK
jgi:hypothetical protein